MTDSASEPPSPDEVLRRQAAAELARHLKRGTSLIARCEVLAAGEGGDKLGPLYAAARLMQANARVADVLTHVALVERRRRMIVERISTSDPKHVELNSTIEETNPDDAYDRLMEKFERDLAMRRRKDLEHPISPHEEANLMLQEEFWLEDHPEDRRRR